MPLIKLSELPKWVLILFLHGAVVFSQPFNCNEKKIRGESYKSVEQLEKMGKMKQARPFHLICLGLNLTDSVIYSALITHLPSAEWGSGRLRPDEYCDFTIYPPFKLK